MPVVELKGDLLASDCKVIAHGCNCFRTMGSGVARAIRQRYPRAYDADLATSYGDRSKLGSYSAVYDKQDDRWIVNLYTQFTFGTKPVELDYEALEKGLQCLKALSEPDWKIGLPMIGCGLAGGNWTRVKAIIETVFNDRTVYIYQL